MHSTHKQLPRRRRARMVIAAGVAAVALSLGGYAIAASGSGGGTPAAGTAPTPKVIPFHRGEPSPAKVVGQVPAGWKAGAGTPVTGEAAEKAKAAAVAAYPGGTVNRVVLLSDGDYNVHIIGVNWPHHVFVSKTFQVLGAE